MIRITKMTPVEWLEMDFKECYDWDQSVEDTFNKAKQFEFDIIDEFGKFIYDKNLFIIMKITAGRVYFIIRNIIH